MLEQYSCYDPRFATLPTVRTILLYCTCAVCQCCSFVVVLSTSLFFSDAGLWDEAGCRVEASDETQTRCVCSHLSTFAVLMDVHDYVVSEFDWKVTNSYRGSFTCKCRNESLCTILLDWKRAKKQTSFSWGGLRLSQLGTSYTVWPIVPVPDGRWLWLWSKQWNEVW